MFAAKGIPIPAQRQITSVTQKRDDDHFAFTTTSTILPFTGPRFFIENSMSSYQSRRFSPSPWFVASMYFVASSIWIASTERLLRHISADPDFLTYADIWKGLFFVFATTGILYVLLRKLSRGSNELEKIVAARTEALRHSEEHYRVLFDNNPLPMWVFERKSLRFLAVNEAAIRHYGYSRDEFLGMTLLDIQPPEEVATVLELISTPTRGLQSTENGRHRRKDRSIIEVEVTSHSLNFRGVDAELVLANDITARRKNEELLLQSQERFAKSFRSSPFGITISSEEEGRYLDVNPAFLEMMGYEFDEMVGKTTVELNIWADIEQRKVMIDQLKNQHRLTPMQVRFRTRSGQYRLVELAAERIQLNDQPCVLAIIHDITEAKHLEQQFLQAQKMEAVGRLAAGVAHDFNNMLGVIIGYSEIAKDRLERNHPAQACLSEIKMAGDRAVALVQQLLAVSRQQVLTLRSLNLNSVVHHASRLLLRMIGEDISLVFRPTEPLSSVHADLNQIEQVLMNLAVNARDAMPKGGKIIIETLNQELDETFKLDHLQVKPGPYVMLSFADTGVGMDEATLAKIFEPFFTTKEPGKGTGLGLSTVYGIVKQSGGYISADSEPGRGTTFRIYLPSIDKPAEHLKAPKPETVPHAGTETVLVVEDEPALRNLTVQILKDSGYRVLSAESAGRSLALARHYDSDIDVVLTDVVMPDLPGPDLVAEMKKTRAGMKVLYMSGYSKDAMVGQGLFGDDSSLIVKPFSTQTLLSKMRAVLESS
jgi:two-component system cell cycle sensor histidine kinase/response regulator CckA